jgi:SAM-dependent methyltransferase
VLEPDERKTLRGKRAGAPVTFVNAVAESIPFEEARFDRVVSLMSFHHFQDGEKVCREVARVLAPGGRFVIYDIRRLSLAARWLSLFVHGHGHDAYMFVTPERLDSWLAAAGLRATRRESFWSGTFVLAERERTDRAAKPI